jgi:NADP-reducing hydrogenase subunit HndB
VVESKKVLFSIINGEIVMPKLTIEDLNKIREDAKKKSRLSEEGTGVKITVHMGTCGLAAGAGGVMDTLLEEQEETDRRDIQIMNSGCMGMCSSEPNVTVAEEGKEAIIYQHVDRKRMRQIFRRHVLKGEVQTDFALARIEQ